MLYNIQWDGIDEQYDVFIYFVIISLRDIILVWEGKDEAVNRDLLWLVSSKGRRKPSFACACRKSAEILTNYLLAIKPKRIYFIERVQNCLYFNISFKSVYKFVFGLKTGYSPSLLSKIFDVDFCYLCLRASHNGWLI